MPKCALKCCGNRSSGPNRTQGLDFYSFYAVPRPVREQWVKIVARERCDPNYKPTTNSVICAEHFEAYEKSPAKSLYSTAIPTINIGPYDDTIIVEQEYIGKDADLVCIIENQIPTQRNSAQDDDIVCVIENQICIEPKPETTGEQDIDIEDQLQWSLVGTSKPFDGLLHSRDLQIPPPQEPTSSVEEKKYLDDDVIIVEHDDSDTESEHEFNYQYSQLLKRPKKVQTKQMIEEEIEHVNNVAKSETEKEFKDQYSQFLRTYNKDLYNYKLRNLRVARKKLYADKDGQKLGEALKEPEKFIISKQPTTATPTQLETITQQPRPQYQPTIAAPKQFETITQQTTPLSPQNFVTIQPRPSAQKQLKTTTHQSIPTPLQQLTTITQQLIPTDPKQFAATTQQHIPVQLMKLSQLPTPQFATTSQYATTPHIATPVFATSPQTSTPLMVYEAASPLNGTTQLYTLVPSNFSVSGVQLLNVVPNDNNNQTYYISNILPPSTTTSI